MKNTISLIMDNDFETESKYRYTVGQFMNLNPRVVKLPVELKNIFEKYVIPDCCNAYNNKYNDRFYPEGSDSEKKPSKTMGLRKREAYSDVNILSELRHAFSSVVKGSNGTVLAIATIGQILIPNTMVQQVAQLFFDTIIQSPKQIQEYLIVLFSFHQPNHLERKIQPAFVKIVMNVFDNPVVLPDTVLEAGSARSRKHRETTCKLLASLFGYNFDPVNDPNHVLPSKTFGNVEKLKTRLLEPMIMEARESADGIKNLSGVWNIIDRAGYSETLDLYKSQLKQIYDDDKFKLAVRILLRDYCE